MEQGARLAKERDSNRRKFEDMSATEQQILEDFDTGKAAKRHAQERGKKCHFSAAKCCELSLTTSPNATATEHGYAVSLDANFFKRHCYRAWLYSDPRSKLASTVALQNVRLLLCLA
jgi:hypothetical protein